MVVVGFYGNVSRRKWNKFCNFARRNFEGANVETIVGCVANIYWGLPFLESSILRIFFFLHLGWWLAPRFVEYATMVNSCPGPIILGLPPSGTLQKDILSFYSNLTKCEKKCRLDELCMKHYPHYSRTMIQSFILQGMKNINQEILVNIGTNLLA